MRDRRRGGDGARDRGGNGGGGDGCGNGRRGGAFARYSAIEVAEAAARETRGGRIGETGDHALEGRLRPVAVAAIELLKGVEIEFLRALLGPVRVLAIGTVAVAAGIVGCGGVVDRRGLDWEGAGGRERIEPRKREDQGACKHDGAPLARSDLRPKHDAPSCAATRSNDGDVLRGQYGQTLPRKCEKWGTTRRCDARRTGTPRDTC